MTRLIAPLILITFATGGQITDKFSGTNIPAHKKNVAVNIEPFELSVYDNNGSMAYGLEYVLTDKTLEIIFMSDLEGEKDSTLFKGDLPQNDILYRLSNINIDSLQEVYYNRYVSDGSQLTITLKKNNKRKTVYLSNYYHADIGLLIELVNNLTPEKYKIWYDKETLLKQQGKL